MAQPWRQMRVMTLEKREKMATYRQADHHNPGMSTQGDFDLSMVLWFMKS